MFKRKLLSLGHPSAEKLDVSSDLELRSLVLWLEDQKLRHYKIEERDGLRQLQSNDWPQAFKSYLADLACPVKSKHSVSTEQLEWLLGYAVKLEYADNLENYKKVSLTSGEPKTSKAPQVITANPLDNLDFNSQEFIQGVNSLADLLKLSRHPNHLVTLAAISRIVSRRLNPEALVNPDKVVVKGTPFPFQDADPGVDTSDYVINHAAKVLRLLYIRDMRELQTQINGCIVAVQNVTANPKTDTKLGKVGF